MSIFMTFLTPESSSELPFYALHSRRLQLWWRISVYGGNCAIAVVDDANRETDGVLPGKLKLGTPGANDDGRV